METALKNYVGQLRIGEKQVYKNMAVFSLLSTYAASVDPGGE